MLLIERSGAFGGCLIHYILEQLMSSPCREQQAQRLVKGSVKTMARVNRSPAEKSIRVSTSFITSLPYMLVSIEYDLLHNFEHGSEKLLSVHAPI